MLQDDDAAVVIEPERVVKAEAEVVVNLETEKKRRRLTARVWKFFDLCKIGTTEYAMCKLEKHEDGTTKPCKHRISYKLGNTSGMNYHMKSAHKSEWNENENDEINDVERNEVNANDVPGIVNRENADIRRFLNPARSVALSEIQKSKIDDLLMLFIVMMIMMMLLMMMMMMMMMMMIQEFPLIGAIAQKILGIPSTSAEVERIFSMLGIIINKRRNRLSPELAETLVFLKKNITLLRMSGPAYAAQFESVEELYDIYEEEYRSDNE
jgi:hypothetical protein